ncbi:MAG: hypothetical protein A4E49_00808 [Methanosaeta sp. PtaU1.Bin112]|nr:MAG: hypothetical protein A4E49_00808 [Methanosaeta sp. PtaU1.Bin112]
MSKINSGLVLFSLLMALSLGVAIGEEVVANENVSENATENASENLTINDTDNATIEVAENDSVETTEVKA